MRLKSSKLNDDLLNNVYKDKNMSESLYESLGGTEGITNIANNVVDNHLANKSISARFTDSDVNALKKGAATFFITGTGGPNVYEGKGMLSIKV